MLTTTPWCCCDFVASKTTNFAKIFLLFSMTIDMGLRTTSNFSNRTWNVHFHYNQSYESVAFFFRCFLDRLTRVWCLPPSIFDTLKTFPHSSVLHSCDVCTRNCNSFFLPFLFCFIRPADDQKRKKCQFVNINIAWWFFLLRKKFISVSLGTVRHRLSFKPLLIGWRFSVDFASC